MNVPFPPGAVVADAMLQHPTTHPADATVGELRTYFRDDHAHIALLVNGRTLVAAIRRKDLGEDMRDTQPAAGIVLSEQRSISPTILLKSVHQYMVRECHRRLVVTDGDDRLLGLLCLKRSGRGFCSDADIRSRRLHAD